MQIEVVKSKIHRVTVTGADLNYIGSITIDEALMEASNIIEGEKVQIVNINNGERLETYAIKGNKNSGEITLNGPAARKVQRGDVIIIISYAQMDFEEAKSFKPSLVFPNEKNNTLT
ncbi:aspartate 1-decarboxylase [Robertkochia marina]|uniref:Aspartate 1-decarboxylase n=1 Tax=Robertkochia marina TaxID=1227945 RepID=A0A4S3M3S3_9FLAO|nr:aspartate 1-decarboxylase [Robertkochia marina]THD69530.1 aspartate 1-decarboxylase [Robertkochia marina]TRZ47211.1 aspartate 1-decarboxylase [Robertkochia marina]